MDEHGLKVMQSAEEAGLSPEEWVDQIAERFQETWKRLEISNDDFIRTTEARHRVAVEAMIERLREAGDLYTDTYAGYYCVGCEAFKAEDELIQIGRASCRERGWDAEGEVGATETETEDKK